MQPFHDKLLSKFPSLRRLVSSLLGKSPLSFYRTSGRRKKTSEGGSTLHISEAAGSHSKVPPLDEIFDAAWYLTRYRDVSGSGVDPLKHFLRQGESQGRDPSPTFSTQYYRTVYMHGEPRDASPTLHYLQIGRALGYSTYPESSIFDAAWYLDKYRDVAAAGVDPLEHYLFNGESEGRDPSANFSTLYYRSTYMKGEESNDSPLGHYLRIGRSLGHEARLASDLYGTQVLAKEQSYGIELPELVRHIALMPVRPYFLVLATNAKCGSVAHVERSLNAQIYPRWTLCETKAELIQQARRFGDQLWFMVWLEASDTLHSSALYSFASAINKDSDVDLIYGDEDELTSAGVRLNPSHKTGSTPDDEISADTLGSGTCVSGSIALQALHASSERSDFLLRAAALARTASHVGSMVVHRLRALKPDDPLHITDAVLTRTESVRVGAAVVPFVFEESECPSLDDVARGKAKHRDDIPPLIPPSGRTAVVYLARGADGDCHEQFDRFVRAYTTYPAGLAHELIVLFKGFPSESSLDEGRKAFGSLTFKEFHTDDESLDLGAYGHVAQHLDVDRMCFLNTKSEPTAEYWLLKLAVNLEQPGVGLVGATGSFQRHMVSYPRFPSFPNLHVRSNAFMMRADHARRILGNLHIHSKMDAWLVESGTASITRQIIAMGYAPLIVGRNGRGYAPQWWASSNTYCQGDQDNLLIHDNQTRLYASSPADLKRLYCTATWGDTKSTVSLFMEATP